MDKLMNKARPRHLDLLRIRQPLPAIVSILHRMSGAALFLFLPFLLYLLDASLSAPETYVRYRDLIAQPLAKLILIGLLWAFLHHLLAGLRFLALDVHWGTELHTARTSSWAVLAISLPLTFVLGIWLW